MILIVIDLVMTNISKHADQLFWVIGAMERLQHLGYIRGAFQYIKQDRMDEWAKIDARRLEIVDDNALRGATMYLCRKGGLRDREETEEMILLVKNFRDQRELLVRNAMEKNMI